MKIKTAIIIGLSAVLVGSSLGYGYRTIKQNEAKTVCNKVASAQVKNFKQGLEAISLTEQCLASIESIPFHGKDKEIVQIKTALNEVKNLLPFLALAENIKPSPNPSASPNPSVSPVVIKPSHIVKSDDLVKCNNMDWEHKNGSLPAFLDSLSDNDFRDYQNAVDKSCNWHYSQIKASLDRYASSQIKTPITDDSNKDQIIPQTGSAVIKSQGHDLYEWQRKDMEKRDQDNAGSAWERGSGRAYDYDSSGVYTGK